MPTLPMPPSDDEKIRKNTTEQYAALGRFVEAFELMVDEVREISVQCIYKSVCNDDQNIKRDDQTWDDRFEEILTHLKFIEIPLHHQNMAAKALFDVMRAIIAEVVNKPSSPHYENREKFKSILTCIEKEYSHLQNKRNELLHATWFICPTASIVKYMRCGKLLESQKLLNNAQS